MATRWLWGFWYWPHVIMAIDHRKPEGSDEPERARGGQSGPEGARGDLRGPCRVRGWPNCCNTVAPWLLEGAIQGLVGPEEYIMRLTAFPTKMKTVRGGQRGSEGVRGGEGGSEEVRGGHGVHGV